MLILAYLHCRTADWDPNSGMYIHQKSEYSSNWEDKSGLGSELKSMQCRYGLVVEYNHMVWNPNPSQYLNPCLAM